MNPSSNVQSHQQNHFPNEDILKRELYFLIYKFLEQSPLKESFEVLKRELQSNPRLLPPQYEWTTGLERLLPSTSLSSSSSTNDILQQVLSQHRHITADHLFRSLKQAHQALSQISPLPVPNSVVSFLSAGRFSLVRPIPKKSLIPQQDDELVPNQSNPYSLASLSNHRNHAPLLSSRRFSSANFPGHVCQTLFSRQLAGSKPIAHLWSIRFYEQYQKYHRVLGHLSSVFCVLFDRTGRYLITGADDAIIKIWSAVTGRLLASLRGHQGEITDLSVSMENDMLASGSCDKKIRVWNLRTTALITTLKAHEDQISGVKFCPLMTSNTRYLVSISQDGSVCFFKYDATTRQFQDQPIRFVERKRRDSQLVSSSFSAGGAFFAVGSTDAVLYVYHLSAPSGPAKILEIEQHTDHVDSLQFSNQSMLKFISGGRDGLAHIWNYEKQKWHNLRIDINERLAGTSPETAEEVGNTKKGGIRVCMVAWTIDDRYVITSLTDSSIKVWWAHNAKLKHILYGHEDEVYIIEPHPTDGRIILTGGHDGAIMIWDVVTGTNIKTFYNAIDGQGSGSLFDAKWNPDGTMFAVTDSYGHVLFFGLSLHNPYTELPEQMFFHTDYRPLVRDANDFVIDEQMQIAPHLMPPPFLVDIDGNPYPPNLQRLVPGREHCLDSQLIPYVDNYQVPFQDQQQGQRQTIDDMIEQLQRNVDNNLAQNNPTNHDNYQAQMNVQLLRQQQQQQPRNAAPSRDMGQRRNGDVEGVRNSANFVSAGGASANQMGTFTKKSLIIPFSDREIESIRQRQNAMTKAEEEYYNNERKKRSSNQEVIAIEEAVQKAKPFTRRQKRINQQRRGVRNTLTSMRAHRAMLNDVEREIDDDIDDENDKDFTGTSEEESTEEDEETSDSDWNQPSTSTSTVVASGVGLSRKRKRRGTDDDGSNSDNEQDRIPQASSNNQEHSLDHPTISRGESSNRPRRSKVEERETRRAERRQRFEQMKLDRYERRFRQVGGEQLDERFRPPDWFTNSKPKRTPYFPQIGDRVVYFRQGHQNYIDAIRQTKCYNINSSTKPFKLRGSDADEIFAKIIGIQYYVKPPRLVTLKMVVIDPQSDDGQQMDTLSSPQSNLGQQQFSVRYHDLDHVCDFIILKQLYDLSISRDWRVNDIFRSVIDDKWWIGRIHSIRYTEENSYFQSIEVIWSNGEKELLSPWDLEPINPNSSPNGELDGVPVTDEERITFSMIDEQEWRQKQREQQRQRLINGLIRIIQFSHAEDFAVPVDLNQHPIYAMIVPYPMDLSTIMARLENNFYRRLEAVKFDVRFIESNASLYNVSESEIVKKAKIITECCLRFIDDPECVDPMPIYNDVSNSYSELNLSGTSASQNILPTESLSNGQTDQRPRRSTRRVRVIFSDSDIDEPHQTSRSSSTRDHRRSVRHRQSDHEQQQPQPIKSWKQLCRELIDYIFELQDSEPFRAPVDPILYPNYVHVIDTPMDLTTVKEQLLADIYDSPQDFCKDMRLIFTNSKTYNTNKKSRIYSMTVRLSALFEERMRKVMSDWKSARMRGHKRGSGGQTSQSSSSRRSRSRGGAGGGCLKSPPMSPTASPDDQLIRPSKRFHQASSSVVDLNQPSTSSAGYSSSNQNNINHQHRSSHRISSHYHQTSSSSTSMEKYGLRHRNKRVRTYKEDSDDDDDEEDEDDGDEDDDVSESMEQGHESTANFCNDQLSVNYHLRRSNRKSISLNSGSEDLVDEEEFVEEEATVKDEDTDDKTENDSNDEKTDVESEDEKEEIEEEDDEDEQMNDSDATQVDQEDENKENSSLRGGIKRPVRAAARKRVNYDENDDSDSDDTGSTRIRERNVNIRSSTSQHRRRNSFASINESSHESTMSSNSNRSTSTGCVNTGASDDDDNAKLNHQASSGQLRRSTRKIRPKRRYSSEDSAEEQYHRRQRTYHTHYDTSDLYSAVKTRHRSGSTGHHGHHHRGSSSRHTQRINYNEDDVEHQIFGTSDGQSSTTYSTRRSSVFTNGGSRPAALIGR